MPADLVGSVLVLKELYDLSDPQTAEALRFDIRWKVACGRSLSQTSFDPSTLVYWRKRIARSDRPDRVFDAVARVIADTGVLTGRRKRCVDSTVFDDAVATQDTVTQLVAAMRKAARLVPGAAAVIARVAKLDYAKPGKPDIDWDDPAAKQELVSVLVCDALAVLAELTGPDAPQREATAADALGLLALVAGQDVEPADGSDGTDGRWRIARKVAHDRVISTVDTEARHTRKSKSNRKDGFRGHVATEPETGLITDTELTRAAGEEGSDAVVGEQMIARDSYHGTGADDAGPDAAPPIADTPGGTDDGATQPDPARSRHTRARTPPHPPGLVRLSMGWPPGPPRTGAGRGSSVRRLRVRHRRSPREVPRRRARHGDQTEAAVPGRARRVHPRRLHHRRAGAHRHLPGRAHPGHEP
ncbi:transposase [Mycolicibacterium litorale]|uniref:Transposase n=1 Tax=Candidatus Mycolicibacterium alkanivorans TaxID=2954114 RepID=A0ABS9YW76_9MYCO|nr:transposase [Candidatus Mycolicibacterium alkanivorans]MCI4675018.1 transposase [Candidatus Mycolicibacterium alkanivorans]